jgi:tetratricopeptide (TPR) repeat protein
VREGRAPTPHEVLHEDIARPSSLALPAQAAAERGLASPRALAKRLSGDLDAILLKALRRDPADRYASVSELDDDIRRHLDEKPVHARAGTFRYLAGRFVRRHRLAIGAAAAVFLALSVGLAVAERERRFALAQKDRAERHLAAARQMANYLVFDVHDRIRDLPGATRAREGLVGKASDYLASIETDARDDPAYRLELADARVRLADIQGRYGAANVGKWTEALEGYDKAIALVEPAALSGDAAAAEVAGRALRSKGQLLYAQDKAAEAREAFRRGVAVVAPFAKAPGAGPAQRLDHAILVVEHARIAALREGRPVLHDALRESLATARAVRDGLPADAPAALRDRATRDLAWLTNYLGHWHRSGEGAENRRLALERFRESLALNELLLAQAPLDMSLRRSVAAHHTFIGLTLAQDGAVAEAPSHVTKAVEEIETLAQGDPANVQYRLDALFVRATQARVFVDASRFDQAIGAVAHGLAHHGALPEAMRATGNNQWILADLRQWEGEARLGRLGRLPAPGRAAERAAARASLEDALRSLDAVDRTGTERLRTGPRREAIGKLLALAGP